jgi:hypothetical protein
LQISDAAKVFIKKYMELNALMEGKADSIAKKCGVADADIEAEK